MSRMRNCMERFTAPCIEYRFEERLGCFVPSTEMDFHIAQTKGFPTKFGESEYEKVLDQLSGAGYWLSILQEEVA